MTAALEAEIDSLRRRVEKLEAEKHRVRTWSEVVYEWDMIVADVWIDDFARKLRNLVDREEKRE